MQICWNLILACVRISWIIVKLIQEELKLKALAGVCFNKEARKKRGCYDG